MNYTLREAEKADMPQVLKLIQQLATYEKEPDAVVVDTADLEKYGFGPEKLFYCYVVEVDQQIKGMALFYFRYSTWKGKTIHLEDLIVDEAYRAKGLGMALYRKVMEFGAAHKVKRIEWVVLDWNQSAIDFYKHTGATVFEDWNTVQFDEQAYLTFLKQQA